MVRTIAQAPDYPLVLLIDLFDFSGPTGRVPEPATVRRVRVYQAVL